MIENTENEGWASFLKFLISAVPIMGIYVAVKVKYGKVKFLNAVVSGLIGVAFAWLFEGAIMHFFEEWAYTPLIALLAITGRDIAFWFIFKFKISVILDKVQDAFFTWIQEKFKNLLK